MAWGENSTRRATTKKEVKEIKNDFYFSVLKHLKQGMSPTQIAKHTKRSIQNISFYLSVLKRNGYIIKVGYGTWEVTKKGDYVRTKSDLWGTHEAQKRVEIWRMGYRYFIRHDNPILALKEQTLKNGGKVSQGRVGNCWVMKGKETLDIYGSVFKSNHVWDAAMKALAEIIGCKGHLEDEYHLMLEPMRALKPDIIINTPETRALADKIHNEIGVLRTEMIDIDGGSKTGRPEFEARTLGTAKNVLDNLAFANYAQDIQDKVAHIESSMRGYMPQQLAISNALNMQSLSIREISNAVDKIADVLKTLTGRNLLPVSVPNNTTKPSSVPKSGISAYLYDDHEQRGKTDIVQIEMLNSVPDFVGLFKNEVKEYCGLRAGSRIYMEWQTAKLLISKNQARIVRGG